MNKDQDLITKIRQNGNEELGKVYILYRNEIIGWLCKNYKLDIDQAKDVYQLTILKFRDNVMENKLTILTSTLKTYLIGISKNLALVELKQYHRKSTNEIDDIIADDSDKQAKKIKEIRILKMETSLEEIGENCKKILKYYYYENKTMDWIAQKMAYKNTDSVKNQKYKCLQKLRKGGVL